MSMIKSHILAMSPYSPPLDGRNPKVHALLDFNERTIPVGDIIVDALTQYIRDGRLQQYPAYGDIVSRLAQYAGVKDDQLMITNGSDQGIDLVFRAVAKEGAEAIIPGPSFAMYSQCAKVESMKIIEPIYSKEQGYPLQEVLAAISPQTVIIVVSNPNNPCGTLVSQNDIVTISQAAPHAAILVDECYFEYSRETILPLLNDLPNIFVTRTFSKTWGIPSLRFAYLISSSDHIRALCNVRGPYDINQLAVVAAQAALENPDYTDVYVREVMQKAKPLLESWLLENNIEFWKSSANYIWVFMADAENINAYLNQQGILVRPKKYGQTLGLRITVGTVEQTKNLISLLELYLKNSSI